MARFGRDFVRAATQPAYLEGLFTAAQGLGSAPRRRREEEEKQERLGMLRNLSPVEAAQYRIDTAKTEQELLEGQQTLQAALASERERAKREQAAKQEKARVDYFNALGKDYIELYNMGVSTSDILNQRKEDEIMEGKKRLGEVLNLEDSVVSSMTVPQILSEVNKLKQPGPEAIKAYATFIGNNKGQITEANYTEAINLAIQAHGVEGISKVNSMYTKSLERAEKAKNNKIVEAQVVLTDGLGIQDSFGTTNISKVKVAVNDKGKLTPESEAYLSNVASSAYIPSINYNWKPKENNKNNNETPTDPNDPTLGELF
jgi:hypothetical protein